ncbi:MAG TPA: ParB/RepB/Spo0J family partition protein [Candidatus Dormibacteraeota bacterium]|nr:ParB/RepB/Spo0J family partition protein [Candidatus Dormibacteraeota bacterium]
MRHDAHYVEELSLAANSPVGRLIAIDKLDPNPGQPRVDLGDLGELTDSIREKGVLEPLLVRPSRLGRWTIIAGERRWRAARQAGLMEVPCIEMDVDEPSAAEITLIENMQRKDLTAWEEADGLRALCDRFGYTHEDVARKVGKSRSTVTEALSISTIPESIREICRQANISSKSVLLQIVRQPDEASMRGMAEQIAQEGLTRDGARKARRVYVDPAAASEPYTFRYEAPGKEYRLEIRFRKSEATVDDLYDALDAAAEHINKTLA